MNKILFILSMVFLASFLLLGTSSFIQHGLSGMKKMNRRLRNIMRASGMLYVITFIAWVIVQSMN